MVVDMDPVAAAVDPPADTFGDPAQLLDIDTHELTGTFRAGFATRTRLADKTRTVRSRARSIKVGRVERSMIWSVARR